MAIRKADQIVHKAAWLYYSHGLRQDEVARKLNISRASAEQRAALTRLAETRLPDVVARVSARLGVLPRRVRVANQNSRWGSCSARGDVRFSWRMAELPEAAFEYIVVHELAHLRVMNHSRKFWDVVHSVLPDYKARRAELRAYPRARQ